MKFGLTDSQYLFLKQTLINPLKEKGATVWIFGSRARGDHRKHSDVDVMVESDDDMLGEIGKLDEILVASNFPYKVDIVQLEDFAAEYLNEFEREKVSV